jgi:NAD(P)H-nitrite reductase large subunit
MMIRAAQRPALVVVGTGMAGARLVEEVIARAPDRFTIRMFGAERHAAYNRLLLSSVLGGWADPEQLWIAQPDWYDKRGIFVHAGVRAEVIDREHRTVTGRHVDEPYDYLVLATGSRPFVPPLDGTDLNGVFVFRSLDDCAAIAARAQEGSRAVVLGGGLLGLEAARGLLSQDLEVTVLETAPHLMPQQLDATAGALLQHKLEAMGVRVLVGTTAAKLLGNEVVTGVQLVDGHVLQTDMVVISCGIRANTEEARAAGLAVERAIVVDDQLRTSDPSVFALGECAQHRGTVYGLVDPAYEQARVLADVLCESRADAAYCGSRLATTLKVMGVDLISMGDIQAAGSDSEIYTHLDAHSGTYKKLVIRDDRLSGAILLGVPDLGARLASLFRNGEEIGQTALEFLVGGTSRDALLAEGSGADIGRISDETQICNCHGVSKGQITAAICAGKSTIEGLGAATRAGTGCGTCQPLLGQLLACYGKLPLGAGKDKNKIEIIKTEKDGLDALPDIQRLARRNAWEEMSEADKQRFKWHGLFFRPPTPGNFMLRIRHEAGRSSAHQFRMLAELSDTYGKGFCDLTTRQQIQLRWFTLGDVPEIWHRLEEAGLNSKQTGMDNVRGVCGCPVAGLTPQELLDATPAVRAFSAMIVGNPEFSNLPRKFNVTITGCLENCCHVDTQDVALVPAYRELDGQQVNGFNVLVGGKLGSGGYRPATPLDIFAPPGDAAALCAEITRVFRDHGSRAARTRARLAFLIETRGEAWFRAELERRWGRQLLKAGTDLRKKHHADHLGIHPQRRSQLQAEGPQLFYVGFLVPVGRITTAQMRGVAEVADRYGDGQIRLTIGQNLVIPNIPEDRIGRLSDEPIFHELPYDPSPIMRGLVSCTGNDYCPLALIETKGYALQVARELEQRTAGRKLLPLTIHWSGCSAGCGMHQVATIGLQGCRARVDGQVVDAAHVCINGRSGPNPVPATDVMFDVPCAKLAEALEPLVNYLPRA